MGIALPRAVSSPSNKPAPKRLDAKNMRRDDLPSVAATAAASAASLSSGDGNDDKEEEDRDASSGDDRDGLWWIGVNNRNASPPSHLTSTKHHGSIIPENHDILFFFSCLQRSSSFH
mmetsp:Transcript_34607/g.81588  ORF Transcript_34607/g.81588 Transcript_34607/m.81588 type:complete len:117 (-) Transcript_34607:246-596(-)